MLLQFLLHAPSSEARFRITLEAHKAAKHAELTPFPALVFPCLFEEMVAAILKPSQPEDIENQNPAVNG